MIECSIENFVHMDAVTKQNAIPSIEFLSVKGNFEREKEVEDTMFGLVKPFTEGLQKHHASSSTPTGGVTQSKTS